MENIPWKLAVPAVLLAVCTYFAARHATGLNVTGLVLCVVWLVVALRSSLGANEPQMQRPDGLTTGMALAMTRALAEHKNSGFPSRPQAADTPPADGTGLAGAAGQAGTAIPLSDKLQLGGKEVFGRIVDRMKDSRGIHVESLLACLGALAGYACQASIRARSLLPGAKSPGMQLVIAQGADGRQYFFGDALNAPLAESRLSLWSLTAGAVQKLGKPLPDITGIFEHVASTVGGPEFGIPRVPEAHRPADLPINYLKTMWPVILPIAKPYCTEPSELPVVLGLAIEQAIVMGRTVIDPTLAARIVMECAVPMSKVDLG
jgi:hypothetical protein